MSRAPSRKTVLFHFVIRLMALVVMILSITAVASVDSGSSAVAGSAFHADMPPPYPDRVAREAASVSPASGTETESHAPLSVAAAPATAAPKEAEEWPVEENTLSVDAVLVPARETVVSSSHDGKISDIPLQNGDRFKKNDVLVRYECGDLEAEADIAGVEKKLTDQKIKTGNKLFKLDIISDVDRLHIETEDAQALAKVKLYEARLNDCTIKAGFDGHVTKRLANEGEYTRTDRVLMEVVSDEPLHMEFLLPSKWLRWVNVGAPVTVSLNETGRAYAAKIVRIYGSVDPVSQSIQVRAALDGYADRLLPGMSGKAEIDVTAIKHAGVSGYLTMGRKS